MEGPSGSSEGAGHLSATRRLVLSLGGAALVVVVGTLGYVGFGYTPLDALFQTVTTVTTVGFGELHKFNDGEEVFTIALILFGVGIAAYAITAFFEYFAEGYLGGAFRRRRMEHDIATMRNHVILCGWGRVGSAIARFLRADGTDVVVIDNDIDRITTVGGPYIVGDATDEEVLRTAGIDRARALITALNTDADNLYVTLTARSMSADVFIVARAAHRAAWGKLQQAGANRVVDPQDLGGARMAALALQPHVAEFLDVVMHEGSLDFRLEQVEVRAGTALAGETLRSARIHERTGVLVLAMRDPEGAFRTNPSPTDGIVEGEVLIVIGDSDGVEKLRGLAGSATPP